MVTKARHIAKPMFSPHLADLSTILENLLFPPSNTFFTWLHVTPISLHFPPTSLDSPFLVSTHLDSHLPDLLTSEGPDFSPQTFPLLYPHSILCNLIQSLDFKYPLYIDNSQIYSSPLQIPTYISNCLLKLSIWIFTRHFKLKISTPELLFLPHKPVPPAIFLSQ